MVNAASASLLTLCLIVLLLARRARVLARAEATERTVQAMAARMDAAGWDAHTIARDIARKPATKAARCRAYDAAVQRWTRA